MGFNTGGYGNILSSFKQENGEKENSVIANSQRLSLLSSSYTGAFRRSFGGRDVVINNKALVASAGSEGVESSGKEDNSSNKGLTEASSDAQENKKISVYVVRKNDTISEISDMFGVSEETIQWSNDISDDSIKEGQVLVILPVSGVRHTVKEGQTLSGIASSYAGDVEEIKQYNGIGGGNLAIGQTLIVPGGQKQTANTTSESAQSSRLNDRKRQTQSSPNVEKGYYIRPIKGGVRTQGIHGHNGVDIAAPVGRSLFASAAGKVLVSDDSGWNGGYGRYVLIAHSNGTKTLYGHMSSIIVDKNQRVAQGQVIGYVGDTGKSTGPHIHFEVRGGRNPF